MRIVCRFRELKFELSPIKSLKLIERHLGCTSTSIANLYVWGRANHSSIMHLELKKLLSVLP